MQIWNTPLSESEIFDFMNCPPSPGTDGLVAYWSFDAGQGDSVVDLSGNGFHGTLINGTAWSEELPPMVCAQQCSSSDSVLVSLFDYPCLCGDGTLWDESSGECVPVLSSQNACGEGTEWDVESQTCIISNPSDTNFDGCVSMTDLLDLLSVFGTCNEILWSCGDPLEYQGYGYETVQIGEQCWFAENLRSENYENGDAILSNLSDSEWQGTTSGAVAMYDEDPSNVETYGRLYNWYAVNDTRGMCPGGWHVPFDLDWITLEVSLGMDLEDANATGWRGTNQGAQLKATSGWLDGGNGSNLSGFSAMPGGNRDYWGAYYHAGTTATFWTGTIDQSASWVRRIELDERIERYTSSHPNGWSVSCIKESD